MPGTAENRSGLALLALLGFVTAMRRRRTT
jgi:MYXO-CTERM domain-containing protein